MKKLKMLSLFFVGVLVLVFAGITVANELSTRPRAEVVDVAYDFPIKPGTDEWKKFTSYGEMLTATQIPDKMLKSMSTRALVKTCLDYPNSGSIGAHNSLQQGLEAIVSGFNGLQELLKRDDAGIELLAQYRLVNEEIKISIKNIDSGDSLNWYYFKHTLIEMLLAQESIRSNMSEGDEKALIKECLNNFNLKKGRQDIYNITSSESMILIMKKVLEKRKAGPLIDEKQAVISDSGMDLFNNVDQIIQQSENFISK
ncbi:MAG: hypothetical protein WC415_05255 [Patescibacteria group bacterium]|jgi:hypothetical protein